MRKKVEKMFHALHKVDMRACYAKQKISLAYPNKKLFHFGITSQSKCSFCELFDETPQHLFYECVYAQNKWNQYRLYLSEKVALTVLTPQSVIFGFTDILDQNCLLVNNLPLIFECNVYNSRVSNTLSFQSFNCGISQIKYIEETISENNHNKKRKFLNKWKLIDHLFQSERNFQNIKTSAKLLGRVYYYFSFYYY